MSKIIKVKVTKLSGSSRLTSKKDCVENLIIASAALCQCEGCK